METRNLKLIGKGVFSKVYQLNDKEVLIKSADYAKECNALYIESRLVPNIEKIDHETYKMEYFPKVKSLKQSLKPKEYELYNTLRGLNVPLGIHIKDCDYYSLWRKEFETKIKDKRVREDLLHIVDSLCNYGTDLRFEISPRNVAVKNGKLVLLDCFFFTSQLNEIRAKKNYKYNY